MSAMNPSWISLLVKLLIVNVSLTIASRSWDLLTSSSNMLDTFEETSWVDAFAELLLKEVLEYRDGE